MNILPFALLALALQNSPAFGTLEGIVVKAGTSEAIPNVRLELRRSDAVRGAGYATTSKADGRFAFRKLSAGRYQLLASGAGYVGVQPISITVDTGKELASIRIPMKMAGVIFGRVYDEKQRLVANAQVDIIKVLSNGGERRLEFNRRLTTNDLGEYRAFWLTPGRYYVSALHPQGRFEQFPVYMLSARRAVTVPLPGTGTGAEYVSVFAPSTTDDQDAQAIDVGSGAEIGGIDITVFPVRKRVARGVIAEAGTGQPVRNGQLFVTRDPTRFNDMPYIGVDSSNGTFEVSSLLPGSYTFLAIAGALNGRMTVDIGDQDLSNLTIPLTTGMNVTGQVGTDGPSPAGMRVSLRPEPEIPNLKSSGPPDSGLVRNDGSFSLLAVPPGEYRLDVTFPPNLHQAFLKSPLDLIRIADGQAESLQIEIGTRPGTLDGRVVDAARQPVAGVRAVLIPGYYTARTDASGRFRIDRLPPGDYRVFASDDPDGAPISAERGTPVHIAEGAATTIDTLLSDDR